MSPSIEVGTRITHVPAAIHAAGGSLVVVTASIPTVILFSESGGWFWRTLMLISLGISAAAA